MNKNGISPEARSDGENTSPQDAGSSTMLDNLELINGIGPKYARALRSAGILSFADLARHSSHTLADLLHQQTQIKITPHRIEEANWIEQAVRLAKEHQARICAGGATCASSDPLNESAVHGASCVQSEGCANFQADWVQHAGFSIFFDRKRAVDARPLWQTRLYHDETGEEIQLTGISPASWSTWLLAQSGLTHAVMEANNGTIDGDAQIEVTGVEVKTALTPEDGRKELQSNLQFSLTSSDLEGLEAEEEVPCQVDVHTVDLTTGSTSLIATHFEKLTAGRKQFSIRHQFPVPNPGQYDLQYTLYLQGRASTFAYHRGPRLRVVAS